jgi:hypothetical protein
MAMRHFLQYVDADRYGLPSTDLTALTNKAMPETIGQVLWVVVGRGRPKTHVLVKAFIVAEVRLVEGGGELVFSLVGSRGVRFEPPQALDRLPWFVSLWKSLGVPGVTPREIRSRTHLVALIGLAESAGWEPEEEEWAEGEEGEL